MNELGDLVPGIAQENGRAAILFSALEDVPDTTTRIVVRVFASDATIAPSDLTLNLVPQIVPYVAVTMDPERIGVGDTASINVKRMNESGVLEDYPQDQLFDVAIRSGERYGVLLSGTQTADRFYEISEGFKFIAADSIDTNVAGAIITVRLPGLPTHPVSNGETDKKAGKKGESTMSPFYFDNGGVGKVVVVNGECEGLPTCIATPQPPHIEIQTHGNGFAGTFLDCSDPRTLGEFMIVDNRRTEPFTVDPCFDAGSGRWNFLVSTIDVNAIIDFCEVNRGNLRFLETTDEAALISDKCCAQIDFRGHNEYPIGGTGRPTAYRIVPAIFGHELQHEFDYQEILLKLKSELFDPEFQKSYMHPTCQTNPTAESAQAYAELLIKAILERLMEKVTNEWNLKVGSEGSEKRELYEKKTQGSLMVTAIVQDFLEALHLSETDCIPPPVCQ